MYFCIQVQNMIYTGVDCRVWWVLLAKKLYHKKSICKISNKICFILLFEPLVFYALAGADLYWIVDACSIVGLVKCHISQSKLQLLRAPMGCLRQRNRGTLQPRFQL